MATRNDDLVTRTDISLDLAQRLIAAVFAESRRRSVELAAAVVGCGGELVAAARMDRAQLGALSIATDKAYTAVSFGFPTSAWAESSMPGGSDWGLGSTLGGRAIVFPGGLPLRKDGMLVGGIGVSGAASTVDELCARAAIVSCELDVA